MHFWRERQVCLSQRCIAYFLCEGGSVLYIVLLRRGAVRCSILVICNHFSNGSSHPSIIVFFAAFKSLHVSICKTVNQIPTKLELLCGM